jgi:hypothetical protein
VVLLPDPSCDSSLASVLARPRHSDWASGRGCAETSRGVSESGSFETGTENGHSLRRKEALFILLGSVGRLPRTSEQSSRRAHGGKMVLYRGQATRTGLRHGVRTSLHAEKDRVTPATTTTARRTAKAVVRHTMTLSGGQDLVIRAHAPALRRARGGSGGSTPAGASTIRGNLRDSERSGFAFLNPCSPCSYRT